MKIQEVLQTTGISKKALQYYEDKGLIEVTKDNSGYRIYDEICVRRLWEIKVLRKLDFSTNEIEAIIKNQDREHIFNEHFNAIDKKMAQCTIQKDYIRQFYEEIEQADDPSLLQEMDQKIQEDFERNEGIQVDIEGSKKGIGLAILVVFVWLSVGFYWVFTKNDLLYKALGLIVVLLSCLNFHKVCKKRLLIPPRSSMDYRVDYVITKAYLSLQRWKKR